MLRSAGYKTTLFGSAEAFLNSDGPREAACLVLDMRMAGLSGSDLQVRLSGMLWRVSLLGPNETTSDDRGCGQVIPEIGITSTPAIDPQSGQHGTMYVVAMSKDGSGNYHQRLHALDLTTGTEQFGAPVEIRATYPGSGSEATFDPKVHKARTLPGSPGPPLTRSLTV